MALIDVVKCEMNPSQLVVKFPSSDLRIGTQLVVHPGQTAIFMKGGVICDEFESGTYTLKTENIPLLNKLIKLPFGGNTPFQAAVWFINKVNVLDSKWGTATPLQIEDPKYEVIVPVRAYGQYGFRIGDGRKFLEQVSSNMSYFSAEKLGDYFRGKILSQLTNIISDKLTADGVSILNINSHLTAISEFATQRLQVFFERFGVSLQVFDIISISVNQDDESFRKLKEAKDMAARLKITGRDVYQMERSFDVLDSAASNQGAAGGMIGAGMGAGVGMGVGVGMAGQMSALTQNINTQPQPLMAPPPLQSQTQYFVAVNNQQQGPYHFDDIATALQNNGISGDTLVWKAGMAGWEKLSTLSEFASYLNAAPPPLPPSLP